MAYFSRKSKRFIQTKPENDSFINILEGSIRSSKTWTMIPKLIFGLNNYNVAGDKIIFGVSKDTIYNNVLTQIFDFVGTDNYTYNRQNGELRLYDTRWNVVGAKDEGSEKYIRGRTVGIAYGDELVLVPKSFFEMMTGRMSPTGARLYGTTNPDNPFHWLHTDYITDEAKIKKGLVNSIKFTLDDNLSLDPETRERYESMYKGVFYKRMIQGLWVVAEGGIYKDCYSDDLKYNNDNMPVGLKQQGGYRQMYIPIDYGTGNPTVFLLIIDDGKTLWIDNEYYWDSRAEGKFQKTDAQYVEDLKKFIAENAPRGAECIVDPSAASLKAEMTQKGVWHCDAVNDVLDGIRTVSSLLAKRKIRIHERCVKLLAELQVYSWDAKAQKIGEDKPIKQHDHAPDALRYFCHTKIAAHRIAA